MFLNIAWSLIHKKYHYKETEDLLYIPDRYINQDTGEPTNECVDKYLKYADDYSSSFISGVKMSIIPLRFIKNIRYEINLIFILDNSTYSLLYVYDNGYIQRYKYNSNSMIRYEECDKNTIQKFYPVGSKVKLKFPIDYNVTEGIIVDNEAEYINSDDFSNVYDLEVNDHGESYITNFYPHYMDILYSDKEPYELFKEEIK